MADSKDSEVPYQIGVMGIVVVAGEVVRGEEIRLCMPPEPHKDMEKV
jgi:MOSC domain-containing protein YiiM